MTMSPNEVVIFTFFKPLSAIVSFVCVMMPFCWLLVCLFPEQLINNIATVNANRHFNVFRIIVVA